ncbi:hypothetical protein ACIBG4_18315 [Nonomuraea sp. NPDC050383]|uniref:hypothetical protein n=1 Tax=Nonomuraea sp. NPDC050383 TaxID=3364362 RepID=UPI00378753F6
MKHLIAGVSTVAMTATLLSAASPPAHAAAAADPVKALQRQMVAGKGVRFTDVTSYVAFDGRTPYLRRTGTLQFGRTGIVASDITAKPLEAPGVPGGLTALAEPERTITVGRKSYNTAAPIYGDLPKGKTWFVPRKKVTNGMSGRYGQVVNPAEPATLKALISGGRRAGRTYSGHITLARLWKISPWYRTTVLVEEKGDDALEYKLTLGSGGLPERLVTSYPATAFLVPAVAGEDSIAVETRYTGWGSRVRITPPPAAKVYTAPSRGERRK